MKYLKMLGLAAVTAVSSMMFVTSSASATTLNNGSETLKAGSVIAASLTGTETAKLEAGSTVLDECSGGAIEGVTGNETGTFIAGFISKAGTIWSGCTKTTTTLSGGEFEFKWTSGSNGSFWLSELEVTVNTIFGSCVYRYNLLTKTVGELIGGSPATLTVNATALKQSGSFACPSEARWTANYTVTVPTTLKAMS